MRDSVPQGLYGLGNEVGTIKADWDGSNPSVRLRGALSDKQACRHVCVCVWVWIWVSVVVLVLVWWVVNEGGGHSSKSCLA